MATALAHARGLIAAGVVSDVMIAATDSLVSARTLAEYQKVDRILSPTSPDGFMAGEGGAAILVSHPSDVPAVVVVGIGMAQEPAPIGSDEPLRADGLTAAIHAALADAAVEMHQIDFRITDISGEQYYFKEAALALSRTLRRRRAEFDIWHPAECIGECGSVAGVATLVVADAASRKGYARGPTMLCHMSDDVGDRAAVILQWTGSHEQ